MPSTFIRSRGRVRLTFLLAALTGLMATGAAPAEVLPAPDLAILPIRLLDTSGEPNDQSAVHTSRLTAMASDLSAQLGGDGEFRIIGISAAVLAQACPVSDAVCILAQARRTGAPLVFVGVIHKSSTLIMQMFARVVDTESGAARITRELNFRGDTDESWQRMTTFLTRDIVKELRTKN